MDERDFFDKLAPTWDDNEVLSTKDKVNFILDFFHLDKGQDVLDLGTGTGVLLPFIAQRIGKEGSLTAVDYSEGMLKRAESKFKDLVPSPKFLNLDFENENIPGEFDRIILYCVYPHLHTPIDTLKWLEKVNLKKHGMISIAFPCSPDFINKIHREKHSESDILPPASVLVDFFKEKGIAASVACDSGEGYVINITPSPEDAI